jgi:hypothetical protein
MIPMRQPVVIDDGNLYIQHDHACYTCGIRRAVYDEKYGIFYPCRECQSDGWTLDYIPNGRWFRRKNRRPR